MHIYIKSTCMDHVESRDAYDRLRDLMHRHSVSQVDLGKVLGIAPSVISRGIKLHKGFDSHWVPIADRFNVSLDWLLRGREMTPAMPRVATAAAEYSTGSEQLLPVTKREQGSVYLVGRAVTEKDTERDPYEKRDGVLPLVGTVAAGSQLISYVEEPRAFQWRRSWVLFRVEGVSAYPVVYPGQFVIVDTDRPVRHNNLVVVETEEPQADGSKRMNAYLKRYCIAATAPDGYVLASINAGIDSPHIPHDQILVIQPVVGVLFEEGKP